jgi:hypothetical protein
MRALRFDRHGSATNKQVARPVRHHTVRKHHSVIDDNAILDLDAVTYERVA